MSQRIINYFIAAVWVGNGLFCKILNLVPRHQAIVTQILGNDFVIENSARPLTFLIGCSELVMAAWVLSRFQSRLNAWAQIGIVATMNVMEFTLAPDLLLWGRMNAFFAFLFIVVVYCNEFLNVKKSPIRR